MSVPVAQNLQNKLWSINAVQALETSGQTESQTYETESTVTACPASSYRESPGLCLCVCVCVCVCVCSCEKDGCDWASTTNHDSQLSQEQVLQLVSKMRLWLQPPPPPTPTPKNKKNILTSRVSARRHNCSLGVSWCSRIFTGSVVTKTKCVVRNRLHYKHGRSPSLTIKSGSRD